MRFQSTFSLSLLLVLLQYVCLLLPSLSVHSSPSVAVTDDNVDDALSIGGGGGGGRMKPKQQPFGYAMAGGGFFAMTQNMGIMRAIYEANILPDITHFGSNSGGTWFATQFAYSKEFYESTVGIGMYTNKDIEEAVGLFGFYYSETMTAAAADAKLNNWTYTVNTSSKLCNTKHVKHVEDVIAKVVTAIGLDLDFPATNWFYYTSRMLGSYLPQIEQQTYASTRDGYSHGVLIVALSLGPDVWNNDATKVATLSGNNNIDFLPISYTAKPSKNGTWNFPNQVKESTLKVSVGKKWNPFRRKIPLNLDPGASLAEIASGSSAAGGEFGSPTLMSNAVAAVLKMNRLNLTKAEQIIAKGVIDACLPLGLQNISSHTEGNVPSTTSSWSPKYRYLDGAYTDASALVHTIAQMQSDCNSSDDDTTQQEYYNCDAGIRAMSIIYALPFSPGGSMNRRLFANCNCGDSGAPLNINLPGSAYNPQIFEEEFPTSLDDPRFTMYSNTTYKFQLKNNSPIVSYGLHMNVTTVENPGWRVSAGTKVEIFVVYATVPKEDVIIWPGFKSNFAFSNIYGKVAQEQANSFPSLLQSWNLLTKKEPMDEHDSKSSSKKEKEEVEHSEL